MITRPVLNLKAAYERVKSTLTGVRQEVDELSGYSSTITHDMASDADYTLSSSENLKGRIVITDVSVNLTVARNIIVATTERLFLAQNDTLQALTFKTSAGTGIDIPKGTARQLLCDGTNVIVAGDTSDTSLLVEHEVTGSAVTSIDFTGLDINTHKSYRVEADLLNATGSTTTISLFINNDTTSTNYYRQAGVFSGSSVSTSKSNTAVIGAILGSARCSIIGNILHQIGDYALGYFSYNKTSGATLELNVNDVAHTAVTANITQLTFSASVASSIAVGSKIRIYRGDE